MNYQKYRDMAFTNPIGKVWLRTIHKREVWERWVAKVAQLGLSQRPLCDYADAILIEAIWHLGFAGDMRSSSTGICENCTARLRGTSRREGMVLGGGAGSGEGSLDKNLFGMPWEFQVLDDFLENEVRPQIPYVTK